MSNSAISFNTAGLASATSAGLVGTGAQTFAGKKTLDGGAFIKGDGTAIPTGYIGEQIPGAVTNGVSLTTTYASITGTNLVLGAGTWHIFANVSMNLNIPANSGSNFTQLTGSVQLYNGSSNLTERSTYLQSSAQTAFGMVVGGYIALNYVVNLTGAGTTTFSLQGRYTVAGTNPGVSVTVNNTSPANSVFFAVRIG